MMTKLPTMTLTTAMMLGICAGPVLAQYQLDNNLEQSSGEINPQATNVDYGSRNDIIYGNINAGKGFRGSLDYGAPGDFRGNTGSDALYRFRANTTQSPSGTDLTKPQSVQRASHSAVLGNIQSYNPNTKSVLSSSGIPVDAYRTGQVTSAGQMVQTPEFGASRAGTIGIQGDLSGRSLGVGATSSQYMGVPTDTPIGAVNLNPISVGGQSSEMGSDTSLIGALSAPQGPGTTLGHGIAGTSDSLWKVDPSKNLAYPDSTAPTTEQIISPALSAPQNLLLPQAANEPGISVEERAARLQAQQMQLEASLQANVGDDAYMMLKNNQENRQRVSQGLQPIEHGVDPRNQLVADPAQVQQLPSHQTLFNSNTGNPMDDTTQAQANSASIRPYPGINTGLEPVGQPAQATSLMNPNYQTPTAPKATVEEQAAARQQLQDAMLQSRGVTDSNSVLDQVIGVPSPSTKPEPYVQPQAPAKPTGGLYAKPQAAAPAAEINVWNANSMAGQNNTQADQVLLGNMGSTAISTGISVPSTQLPQTTSAAQSEWHATRTLAQATAALKAGRYFDAERLFKSVQLGNPQSYEASAGLLCAQLGAGMVRATALNLRQHMTKFPQQMTYKLDRTYLPSGQRLAWVREQADNLMQQYGNFDAALLIAFMGYQTSDAQLLQYGLGLAQKHLPGDPLVAELSRAWLGQ